MYKKEIERRFLVIENDYSKKISFLNTKRIIQGYYRFGDLKKIKGYDKILKKNPEIKNKIIRIRIENKKDIFFTIKKGKGIKREEFEIQLDFDEKIYNFIKNDKKALSKTRGEFFIKGFKAVLDRYTKRYRGIEIVEIEFKTESEAKKFQPSKNLFEITNINELSNMNLYFKDEKEITKKVEEIYGYKN
ncbi:MAG: hypothetical protein ABIN39_04335 [candidate division WOR-3 bacterium]